MPGTIRFFRGLQLGKSKGVQHASSATDSASLLDLLNAVQQSSVYFLPIASHSALGIAGRGFSGDVNQATADVATTLTFKRGIPSELRHDTSSSQDWYSLVTEITILQHTPVRDNPHIIELVGISWDVNPTDKVAWPYTITAKANRGSLRSFLLQGSIEGQQSFQICVEIVGALHTLRQCGIGHGDIKPDNVLIEEDADGNMHSRLTDFGAAVISGQERQPLGTKLWNAPELRVGKLNHVLAEDIMAADLYSLGLLAAHILIPNDDLARAEVFLIEPTQRTSQVLKEFRKQERLTKTLIDIAEASGIPERNQILLQKILDSTLLKNPSDRALPLEQISHLIDDNSSPMESTLPRVVPPPMAYSSTTSTPCIHQVFDVAASVGMLDDADYILRLNVMQEFESKAKSSKCAGCFNLYAAQLALCFRIGFGSSRDMSLSQSWQSKAALSDAEMKKAIERLGIKYQATGRLPEQVRQAIAIGVIVTADRIQQYQLQGRLEAAEVSLRLEVGAREEEYGQSHICTARLKSDLVQILRIRGRLAEAESIQQNTIGIYASRFGDRHPSKLCAQATQASLLADQGLLLQAEETQRKLQPIFKEVLGADHPETVIALQNLAITLHSQSRYEEAADLLREVCERRTKSLTSGHPLTIRAEICLASALHSQGRLKESNELLHSTAEKASRSGDPIIEAHVEMNLAQFYWEAGRLAKAEKAAEQAVNRLGSTLDRNDPMRLSSLEVLATISEDQGNLNEQEQLLRQILYGKSALDKTNPSVSSTRLRLAYNLIKQGRLQEATFEAKQVLEALKQQMKLDPENFLTSTDVIASCLQLSGRREQAGEERQHLHRKFQAELGDTHPFTMLAATSLASFYVDQGWYDKAEQIQANVLDIHRNSQQINKAAVKLARELAITYREQNRFDESIKLCDEALKWCSETLGKDHIDTLAINNAMAATYFQMGSLDKAEALYTTLKDSAKNTSLEPYVLSKLAEARRAQGDMETSEKLFEEVYQAQLAQKGPNHPETLMARGNILRCRLDTRLDDVTENETLDNISMKINAFGISHPTTVKTMTDLATAYAENGRQEDAEKLFQQMESVNAGVSIQNSLHYAIYLAKRADVLFHSGDLDKAAALERQALAIRQTLLPEEDRVVLVSMCNLASTLNASDKSDEAEQLLRRVITIGERCLPPNASPTLNAKNDLAAVLFFQRRLVESEKLFAEVLKASQKIAEGSVVLASRKAQLETVRNELEAAFSSDSATNS